MKNIFILLLALSCSQLLFSQSYPDPEFVNEVYAFRKDSNTLIRLEKDLTKMDTKSKVIGVGGFENGYTIESEKSSVRLNKDLNYSFIFSTGASKNKAADSVMKANGMEEMYSMGSDPSQLLSLYQMDASKGKRKIILMAMQGMNPLVKAKKESTKYPFSVKKIREGYYELVVDKTLPRGEYAFVMKDYSSMDGSITVFAFGIE